MSETFERIDHAALVALKAMALPRCTGADMLKAGDNGDKTEQEQAMKIADEYFRAFLVPGSSPRKCICCGWDLVGLFGSFTWGIAYGEGECSRCGYPARAIHKIEGIGVLSNYVMQYHPDDLDIPERSARTAVR